MGYGKRLMRALPPMALLDDEAAALAWLDELPRRTTPERWRQRPRATRTSTTDRPAGGCLP